MSDQPPAQGIFPDLSKAIALNAWLNKHGGTLATALREVRQNLLFVQQRHQGMVMTALTELETILMN